MRLSRQSIPVCPVCLNAIEKVDASILINHILPMFEAPDSLQTVYAQWYFDANGAVQQLHNHLKYGNRPTYGYALGAQIGMGLRKTPMYAETPDFIMPIPLYKRRRLERGYNQSSMLAEGIATTIESQVLEHILTRDRPTRSQTGLSKEERHKNVEAAFSVRNPNPLKNKHVLLVDDILTTGATLVTATKPLLDAGVRLISIATLAFTRP